MPMTDRRPAALLRLCGKEILLFTLEMLEKAGFEEAVLAVGYGSEQVERLLDEKYSGKIKLSFHYIYASRFVFSIISQSRTKGIVAQMNFYNLIKRVSADTVTFHGKNFCFIAHCRSHSLHSAFACGVYHMELYLT